METILPKAQWQDLNPDLKICMSDVLTIRPDMSTLLSHCCYHPGVDPVNLESGDRAAMEL